MNKETIKAYITAQKRKKHRLTVLLDDVLFLPISESTAIDIKTAISSEVAKCDISIRDHEKLLIGNGQEI